MNRIYCVILALFVVCQAVFASAPINVPGAAIGVYIAPISNDSVTVVDYNSDVCFTPASVMKSLTTATALTLLGPDFRWETLVTTSAPIKKNALRGDMTIVGSGDPTLESRFFIDNSGFCDSLSSVLTANGCRSIAGDIVIDQSALADAGINPSWEIEDIEWDYGAGLYGVNYRDNACRVTDADGKVEWGAVHDPAAVMSHDVDSVLHSYGIAVCNHRQNETDDSRVLMRHMSPKLVDVLHSLMVRSDNLMAEGTLRAIAPGATRKEAIACLRSLWKSRGVDLTYTRILDGSGLARANALSPRQIGAMLRWMARSSYATDYVALFPRVGVEGTVRNFMSKSPESKRYVLKTGSMSGVQCYAGYRIDPTNNMPTHVVVVMINNFTGSRAELRSEVERLLSDTVF